MLRAYWAGLLLVAGVSAASPVAAAGRIYKCKSAEGAIYYSHAYDAKRCAGGGAQLNADGVAIKRIARQKTPQEIAAEKAAAAIEAEKAAVSAAALQADRALTATFASEGELQNFYTAQLKVVDNEIDAAGSVLQSQHRTLGGLLASAADAERANKAVPVRLSQNIASVRDQMDQQRAYLQSRRDRRKELELERDAKIKRFRELSDAVAARRAEQAAQ